jgi:inorganic pyrophosphatase
VDDLGSALLDEIEQFFINYTSQRGKVFEQIGRLGAKQAWKIVENGIAAFDKQRKSPS